MALEKKHMEVVKKVLDIENLQIVPALEESAIVGLGVGLLTSLFYGFKTGCKAGAVVGGCHFAAKVIKAEMFLKMLRPAEVLALMAVISTANSSCIPPYIAAEILMVLKDLAAKHGLALVKAMAA